MANKKKKPEPEYEYRRLKDGHIEFHPSKEFWGGLVLFLLVVYAIGSIINIGDFFKEIKITVCIGIFVASTILLFVGLASFLFLMEHIDESILIKDDEFCYEIKCTNCKHYRKKKSIDDEKNIIIKEYCKRWHYDDEEDDFLYGLNIKLKNHKPCHEFKLDKKRVLDDRKS